MEAFLLPQVQPRTSLEVDMKVGVETTSRVEYIRRAICSSCQLLVLGYLTASFHLLPLSLTMQLSHVELMPAIMEDTVSTTTLVCACLDLPDMTV